MSEKEAQKGFVIPADPSRLRHEAAKERHKQRKAAGKPASVTNAALYDMLSDVLDNQEYIISRLKQK